MVSQLPESPEYALPHTWNADHLTGLTCAKAHQKLYIKLLNVRDGTHEHFLLCAQFQLE